SPATVAAAAECGRDGLEAAPGAGHVSTVVQRHARHDRAEQLGTLGKLERHHRTGKRILEAVMGGFPGFVRGNLVIANVVGDLFKQLVRLRSRCRTHVDLATHVCRLLIMMGEADHCTPWPARIAWALRRRRPTGPAGGGVSWRCGEYRPENHRETARA